MTVVAPDVSEFQTVLTDEFGRRLLIMRVAFGAHYEDKHFLANASKAAELYRRGRIDGVILYTVYLASATPQEQYAWTWKLIGPTVPPWLIAIMLDVESWGGTSYSISGNHSQQLNTLFGLHAHKIGHWSGCIGYGNQYDLAEIWPQRDSRCKVIVASYQSQLIYKKVKGAIGQQYSDGDTRWATPTVSGQSLPRATPPFGHCDHNVFPGYASAASLRAALRPAKTVPPKKPVKPTKPASPHYPETGDNYAHGIDSEDRSWALFITNAGQLETRHKGIAARTI